MKVRFVEFTVNIRSLTLDLGRSIGHLLQRSPTDPELEPKCWIPVPELKTGKTGNHKMAVDHRRDIKRKASALWFSLLTLAAVTPAG